MKHKKALLGIGLDNKDGHRRITKAEDYTIIGGSKDTHEYMQEKAAKFSELLTKKGKNIQELHPQEFIELMEKA